MGETQDTEGVVALDNELMDRLIRGLTVPYTIRETGETVNVKLTDEGVGFIRGKIQSGEVPKLNSFRKDKMEQ